jgi:flagellar hook-associated protein 1 FlgK
VSLSSASVSALRSLGVISDQISVASRNIAGAGTAGVSEKIARVAPGDSGIDFVGVTRTENVALFRNLLSANSEQESANAISGALSRLDLALGLSDASNSRSPAIQISKLSDALRAYSASPQDQTAAQIALSTAQDVVSSLHDASAATQDERRRADQMIAEDVADVNLLLSQFAALNETIVKATASRQDATDALDQRDNVLTELSRKIGVSVVGRPNNDMVLYTDSGVTLYETTPRKVTFQETPNLVPGGMGADVYIDGARVTGSGASMTLQSGSIFGLVKIRDELAPQYQAQLDEIARGLVVAFAEQDQSGAGGPALPGLFTYAGATTVPTATIIPGLSSQIDVATTVDPLRGGSLQKLRDGGISGNAAYVYNPSQASAYADRIIELANTAAATQNFDPAAGLGSTGSLSIFSAASNGWISAQRKQIDGAATYYDELVSQTTQALSNATGVNLDEQMSKMLALENSYQASAKLLQVVNSMYDSLFAAING